MQNSLCTWLTTSESCRPTVLQYGADSLGELSSTNCQKGPSTIRLRYPVPGTVLAGTGFEKMAGYPANRNRISGTSLHWTLIKPSSPASAHGISLQKLTPCCFRCQRQQFSHQYPFVLSPALASSLIKNWRSLTTSDALLVAVFTGWGSFAQSDVLWQLTQPQLWWMID